jgi:hypothetical protein
MKGVQAPAHQTNIFYLNLPTALNFIITEHKIDSPAIHREKIKIPLDFFKVVLDDSSISDV